MNQHYNELIATILPPFEETLKKSIIFNFDDDRKALEKAIQHSVNSNGKRIRPLVCIATEKTLSKTIEISTILSVAIELIHCYSLIHDDLPAMDDDDFRRGQPTCHKAFGEDIAILAGDVLNTLVFEYLATELPKYTTTENTLFAIKKLAQACGPFGMAGGQVLDLKSSSTQSHNLAHLQKIHSLKTGALLQLCFELPTEILTTDETIKNTMKQIGKEYGLLFQIIDDILDETASFKDIGKSPGKDAAQNKLTYISLLGLDNAIIEALKHKENAFKLMDASTVNTDYLKSIFNYTYEKGCQYVH